MKHNSVLLEEEDKEEVGMDISQHGQDAYPEAMAATYMRYASKKEPLEVVPQREVNQRA